MAANLAVVRDFIASWSMRDLDLILSRMTADCFYHNVPFASWTGHAEIRAGLEALVSGASAIEWIIHHEAEGPDGVVFNERTDRFLTAGRWMEVRVVGIFELRDGLIAKWRDYFDPAEVTRHGRT